MARASRWRLPSSPRPPDVPSRDALAERLRALEAEVRRLRARLDAAEAKPPRRCPCSTTSARIELGPRPGPRRAEVFGFGITRMGGTDEHT